MEKNVNTLIDEERKRLRAQEETPPSIPAGIEAKLAERQRRFKQLADANRLPKGGGR